MTITVTALDETREFTGVEELASHVADLLEHRGGIFDPHELACIAELAQHNGAARPEVDRIARKTAFNEPERSKVETPLDARIAEATAEAEAAKAAEAEASDARRGTLRTLEAEAAARFRKAQGNATKVARVESWLAERQAALQDLEGAWRAADDARLRAVARLHALRLARDRYAWEQEVRVVHNGQAVTLAEFEQRRKS